MKAEDRIENKSTKEQLDFDYLRPDDLRLISSMLTEYSDKLEAISTKLFNLKRVLKLSQLLLPTIASILFLPLFYNIYNIYVLTHRGNRASFNTVFMLLCWNLVFTVIVYFFLRFLKDLKRKIRESTRYGQRMALRLEKLVRLGSQLHEIKTNSMPVEIPLQMFVRIELDFRLADAEAALGAFAEAAL